MNLNEIRLDIYRRLKLTDTPGTDQVALVDSFINQRHRDILTRPGIDKLRNATITFDTEANTAVYGLPPVVSKILAISDASNTRRKLDERSVSWLRQMNTITTTGLPHSWIPLGESTVQIQPDAESRVYVVSSNTSENVVATVEYTRTGGYFGTANVTMTGNTVIQIGTDDDIVTVDKFYLSANAAGTITLQKSLISGTSNTLSVIAPGHTQEVFKHIQLFPGPSEVFTYTVDCIRNIPELVNAADQPLLPLDFHSVLTTGARMDYYELNNDDRYTPTQAQYERGITNLLNYVINNPDLIVVPGNVPTAYSNLAGGWYPADTTGVF